VSAVKAVSGVNPFDDPDATFLVLVNDEGQHSLWPAFADVPDGWRIAHDQDTRAACMAYVEANWTDPRPASLIEAMAADRPAARSPGPRGSLSEVGGAGVRRPPGDQASVKSRQGLPSAGSTSTQRAVTQFGQT
jgi:uncharacterized protein YbdZ (MbtH family)